MIPLNSELSSAQMTPMVSVKIELSGLGSGAGDLQRRLLLLGHKQNGYPAPQNTEQRLATQADANRIFGPQSDIAANLQHFLDQLYAQGGSRTAEIFAVSVPEPVGGTKSTKLFRFVATPSVTGAPSTNTGALRSMSATFKLHGWRVTFGIAAGDTFATIATNGAAAITAALASVQNPFNFVFDTVSVVGDTVSVTSTHAGEHYEDMPLSIEFSDETGGVSCSPGKTVIGSAATGAGQFMIAAGSLVVPAAIANADTVSAIASKVTDAVINGTSNIGVINNHSVNAGELIWLYKSDHVCQRIAAACTAAGVTLTTTIGTAGVGVPDLTLMLTNQRKNGARRIWLIPWTTASVLSAIEAHRAEMNNAMNMRDQFMLIGSTLALVNAGALANATTPKLTSTPWWGLVHCPDSPIRGPEHAARAAAMAIGSDTPAMSFNWRPLETTGSAPLGAPHSDVLLDPIDTANTAMQTFRMTPIVVNQDTGEPCILRAVTTAKVVVDALSNWSEVFCLGYARAFIVSKLQRRFIRPPRGSTSQRPMVRESGAPQDTDTVSKDTIEDAIKEGLIDMQEGRDGSVRGVVDGAEALLPSVKAAYNAVGKGRIDAVFAIKHPKPLHQISVVQQHQP